MFDQLIKPILYHILSFITGKWTKIRIEYGILALVASVAVPLKLFLFYHFIGISANFFFVWLITGLLTYFLFASFQNKWIPAIIYTLLTILMFCDVTYSSFFNRYLSVSMIGAAGVLGNISESIKEVLKPWFFLILADAILILTSLAIRQSRSRKKNTETENPDHTEIAASAVDEIDSEGIDEERKDSEVNDEPEAIEIEESSRELEADVSENISEETQEIWKDQVNLTEFYRNTIHRKGRRARRKKQKKIEIKNWLLHHKNLVALLLILVLLVFNFTGNFFITSLSNQEIYSFHIKDLMSGLTGSSGNSDDMTAFTDSYETEKNGSLFGVAKGKNLIVIQIESLQNLVINETYNGQEITPNLNQIIKDNTIYFDHYYQQIGSGNTSDAEFATNHSICGTLASYTYKLYADNYFKGLPKLLEDQGYETAVYHAHEDRSFWNREKAYKSIGFDTYYGGIGGMEKGQYNMTEWMGWGLTDSEFFEQSMQYLKKMTQPFYSFIITLSNHHPYQMLDKYQFIDLLPEDDGTIFGNYLNSAAYTDYSIGLLMQQLKEEGIYDNSIIAFYGDHMGLPKTDEGIYESCISIPGKRL